MKDYEKQCQYLYQSIQSVWPDSNPWYDYTRYKIISFIESHDNLFYPSAKILNAGSGGSEYNILGKMTHLDLANNLIERFPNHIVASIEDMPLPNASFDIIICVGSVINYCDALSAISEIARIITNGGFVILEYERSQTGELWFDKRYNSKVIQQTYTYNGQSNHKLWLYSDSYIESALKLYGLKIKESVYYHSISSIVNRFIQDEEFSGKFSKLDKYIIPLLKRASAHNRIILCQKVTSS